MKDIFIDNCFACRLNNPMTSEQKNFVCWLMNTGCLVVSQKLLVEYYNSNRGATAQYNITAIIDKLTKEGRLIKKNQVELSGHKLPRRLRSNQKDHIHIQTVALSVRKMAYTYDANLKHDIERSVEAAKVGLDIPEIDYVNG